MGIHDSQEHVGFVAQEVQKVIPEAVSTNDKGYLLVNNDPILWSMLNAIKEQQKEIAALRSREQSENKDVEALKQENAQLRQKLEAVATQLQKISNQVGASPAKPENVATTTRSQSSAAASEAPARKSQALH